MSNKSIFKSHIQSVHTYEPGKPMKELERELGLKKIVKLASNENPLGPSPKAVQAMRKAVLESHLYPESSCHDLVQKLSKQLGVSTREIIIGNGSNEIIELLFRGFLNPGEEVLCSETSFLVYPILTQVCGGNYVTVPMRDYRYDLAALANAITEKTRIIFIANPNNPTGTYVTAKEVGAFLRKVPDHVLVCFDEAYVDFVEVKDFPDTITFLKQKKKQIVILRTFSKSCGLAGLRIGYGVAPEEIAQYLHKVRQPFNVNAIAQAGALAALEDKAFLSKTKKMVFQGRKYFYQCFERLGLRYLASQANFVLVDVKEDADKVFQDLLKYGMIVRSMKAYGLKTWIRVTVGTHTQNVLFYCLLKDYLKKITKTQETSFPNK